MAQVTEYLPSKRESLSSKRTAARKKTKQKLLFLLESQIGY
jgi:hypothetical protein